MNLKWRRTEGSIIRQVDWSLLYVYVHHIAQLFNTGEDVLIGSWRWRVWLDHKMHEGSAHSGTEVREPLSDYQ